MRKAKEIKVEYGIQIVKPWSGEMYGHNDKVRRAAVKRLSEVLDHSVNIVMNRHEDIMDLEFKSAASPLMVEIQRAILGYQIGSGFTVREILGRISVDLSYMTYYQLKDIVDDLDIKLDPGFVGF
tara:strand:+ start:1230 stop:1604 length:375 start_codon:yes stop_codon:yes gene_type:complete